jgi:4-amino-4-deoxychorismate lyase
VYDAHRIDVRFEKYVPKDLSILKRVEATPGLDYGYKYCDRTALDTLWKEKGEADEILICRDGWVTDLSFANIAFRKGRAWYTPALPLLAGTTWKRLVYEEKLIPSPIHQKDILLFDCYKVFNAMLDFESATEQPVTTIL